MLRVFTVCHASDNKFNLAPGRNFINHRLALAPTLSKLWQSKLWQAEGHIKMLSVLYLFFSREKTLATIYRDVPLWLKFHSMLESSQVT